MSLRRRRQDNKTDAILYVTILASNVTTNDDTSTGATIQGLRVCAGG